MFCVWSLNFLFMKQTTLFHKDFLVKKEDSLRTVLQLFTNCKTESLETIFYNCSSGSKEMMRELNSWNEESDPIKGKKRVWDMEIKLYEASKNEDVANLNFPICILFCVKAFSSLLNKRWEELTLNSMGLGRGDRGTNPSCSQKFPHNSTFGPPAFHVPNSASVGSTKQGLCSLQYTFVEKIHF